MESKTCKLCGEIFYRKDRRSQRLWDRQKFCSQKCNGANRRAEAGKPPAPSEAASKVCLHCGSRFSKRPDENNISWGKRKHCSASCVGKKHDSNPDRKEKTRQFQKSERGLEVGRSYQRRRRSEDIQFLLASRLRSRLWSALKGKGAKQGSAVKDLGCSLDDLRRHIEGKMLPCMKWENYGRSGGAMCWHIDHVVPLSSFDLTDREEFLRANHYSNLQPMCHIENLRKHSKLAWDRIDVIEECPRRVD